MTIGVLITGIILGVAINLMKRTAVERIELWLIVITFILMTQI